MRSNAIKSGLLAVAAIVLAGCSSGSVLSEVEPNIFPASYRKEVLDTLVPLLGDPYHVRDAYISEPALTSGKDPRYVVCVRYNERDFNQRYLGVKDRIAYFFGGKLNQLIDATPEQCGKAAYKPFTELEKFCLGSGCK